MSLTLWSGPLLAQNAPAPAKPTPDNQRSTNCDNRAAAQGGVQSPETIQGKVTKVDPDQGKLTMQGTDGKVHEFQASKEVLNQYKVGDQIQAKLRRNGNCKPNA